MDQLPAIATIVLIDLALSGDNALVIGMAARGLPGRQRRMAITLGAGAAVGLRVAAAAVATVLLTVPYLQFIGGVVLAFIAYRLVQPAEPKEHRVSSARSLREAIGIIVVADAAMSTENILGVAAASHGDLSLLIFGLALSIPIVLFGSGLVATLLDRVPQVVWLGAAALAWTSADLILGDPGIPLEPVAFGGEIALAAALFGAILVAYRLRRMRA
jgi:YjbE family integral membrane protein